VGTLGRARGVRTLHHVQIAMPRGAEDAAAAFYADVLGLEPISKPADLAARGGRWFRCRGSDIEVHLGVEDPFTPARKAHPAFLVDDLVEIRRALAERGHAILEDTQIEGYDRFYTSDPFGNRIEISAPRRPSCA
jgi:catechol 2,3-dioxygenase-like lactoylglutathione lyase family enzyme